MNDFIEDKVNEWAADDSSIRDINQRIIHLEKRLFRNYLPCQYHDNDFFIRLKKWLKNITISTDQKVFFELIPNIFYIGEKEFDSLYRSAYNIEVARWLIDIINIDFKNKDNHQILNKAVEETWFCPITDSFQINNFIKINNIPSIYDLRPDWHSLAALSDQNSIKKYVLENAIERIVMLEDFIGSGSQVGSKIKFACECLPDTSILCISLITCPKGVSYLNSLSSIFPNLTVKHIVEIPGDYLLSETASVNELSIYTKTRKIACKTYSMVTPEPIGQKPYHPLGYKRTGGLIVLNTNVPDNTLPLLHHTSLTWFPLFKRITRL